MAYATTTVLKSSSFGDAPSFCGLAGPTGSKDYRQDQRQRRY
jgi:hypothetical protein